MARLVGAPDLRETLAFGYHLTFTGGVSDEEVEGLDPDLVSHLLEIIPGLEVRPDSAPVQTPESAEDQ